MNVKKLSGNYIDVFNQLDTLFPGMKSFIEIQSDEKKHDDVTKDLGRTPFVGSQDELAIFADLMLNHHSDGYSQGDYAVTTVAKMPTDYIQIPIATQSKERSTDILHSQKMFDFAYINSKKQASGCALIHFTPLDDCSGWDKDTSYWMFATINQSNAPFKERDITLYVSENMFKLFPECTTETALFQEVDDFKKDLAKQIQHPNVLAWAQSAILVSGQANLDAAKEHIDHTKVSPRTFDLAQLTKEESQFIAAKRAAAIRSGTEIDKRMSPVIDMLNIISPARNIAQLHRKNGQVESADMLDAMTAQISNWGMALLNQPVEENAHDLEGYRARCENLIKETQKTLPFEHTANNYLACFSALDGMKNAFVKLKHVPQKNSEMNNTLSEQLYLALQQLAKMQSDTTKNKKAYDDKTTDILKDTTNRLAEECAKLLNLPATEQAYFREELQNTSKALFESAQKNLPYENAVQVAIINTVLFVLSGVLLYLAAATAKYAMTGEFLLFSPKNPANKALKPIEDTIMSLSDETTEDTIITVSN